MYTINNTQKDVLLLGWWCQKMTNNIENRLKYVRKALKMSQKSFAKFLDTPYRTYQNWELGVRTPDLKTTIKIANKLRVSIDWLVGRENYLIFYNINKEDFFQFVIDLEKRKNKKQKTITNN